MTIARNAKQLLESIQRVELSNKLNANVKCNGILNGEQILYSDVYNILQFRIVPLLLLQCFLACQSSRCLNKNNVV